MITRIAVLSTLIACFSAFTSLNAQQQTVGLFLYDSVSAFEGYTLFAPLDYTSTYLINNCGMQVHKWESSYLPGMSAYLNDNGHLIRTGNLGEEPTFLGGGRGGIVQDVNWDGTIAWEFEYSSNQHLQHHDIEPLPNGNILMIAWEYISDTAAIAAGRNPNMLNEAYLWPDHVIEVQPTGSSSGNIVWEWHVWDHLIQDYDPTKANYGPVANHPELINLNYSARRVPNLRGIPDWNHTNSVDYNEEFDQIILSVHEFCEIWVIDHSTTTAQAASHNGGNSGKGGDLLYRWGNPAAYRAGTITDQKLYFQHDPQWIKPGYPGQGNILIFNNGMGRPGTDFSSVEEIVPPVDSAGNYSLTPGSAYGPAHPIWSYSAVNPPSFYSRNISGAQRLVNGNTLICSGENGILFEVSPDTEIVWLYVNPVTQSGPMTQGNPIGENPNGGRLNRVFKIRRYAPDFPGFQGHPLLPGDPIEFYPNHINDLQIDINPSAITLHWSPILNPLVVYHIYSSENPQNGFAIEDHTNNNIWSTSLNANPRFFRLTFEIAPSAE